MSDTYIISNPPKSDCKTHATTLKRRSRRSNTDLSTQINGCQQNPIFFQNLLTDFYNDPDDNSGNNASPQTKSKSLLKTPGIFSNFRPFELEKSLAMADHIFVQQLSQNKANHFPETQGFVTCTNLGEAKNKPQCCSINRIGQSDSFMITESELISCCHQVEKVLECNGSNQQYSRLHNLTPEKNYDINLVNSILEDFSQSPLSREQIVTNFSCQCTPEFRLRRVPVKNYSRKHLKYTRINLTKRFEEPNARHSSEYDGDLSLCSSLSVQEDDTFCENTNNQSTATTLNNTERLCENLLNLTEYFTQNELKQSFEGDQQSRDNLYSSNKSNDMFSSLHKISDLLDNIITLRSKYSNEFHNDFYDSKDDFNGFESNEYNIDNHIVEQNAVNGNINLAPDFNVGNIRHSNSLIEEGDDWNEDDCHIFACIDTEDVLQQKYIHTTNTKENNFVVNDLHQTFIVPNVPTLNSTVGSLSGFKADSSKSVPVSEQSNIMAANIFNNLSEIPKKPLPNCDNKALSKDENIFENPEDYEWNDDCDLFLNFQTPTSFKESNVRRTHQQLPMLTEFSYYEQNAPSTSKLTTLGFTTATGKSVRVTSKGQAAVQKLLNEFAGEISNNKNYEEELGEIKSKVYAKSHSLKTEPTSLTFKKYQSLRNAQSVRFPIITEENVKNLEKESFAESSQIFEAKIIQTKQPETQIELFLNTSIDVAHAEVLESNKKFNLESNLCEMSSKAQNSMKKPVKDSAGIPSAESLPDIEYIENVFDSKGHQQTADFLSMGFQTANGKQVSISRKAKQAVETLLKDFNAVVDIEQDLRDIKTKVHIKNKDLKAKPSHYTKYNEDSLLIGQPNMQTTQLSTNVDKGFHTANGKEVGISAKAKQAVENFLQKFNTDLDIDACKRDLKELTAKVLSKNKDITPKTLSLEFGEDIVTQNLNEIKALNKKSSLPDKDEKQNKTMNNLNSNMDIGFQTANGIQISMPTKAKQVVENLLKDFNSGDDVETIENYLKDIKTNMENKNKDLQTKSISKTPIETHSDNLAPKLTNCKRKISIDNSDLETYNTTPAVKVYKNDIQFSKSTLAGQSPLKSTTRSVTVRKNLLSLSKKRKNKVNTVNTPTSEISEANKHINDLNACISTPTKSYVLIKSKDPAPETPNLKDFLSNASLTSTPRISKPQGASQTFEDSDLKPIIWKNDTSFCNKSETNSSYATKLSESSTSNISFNSSNPTVKERIGRLNMYGKAPDVSPILIEKTRNCRPSGLRRTRSMLKKNEN